MTDSCWVEAPVDVVWAYLADYRKLLGLASPAVDAALVDGEALHQGARYEATLVWEDMTSAFQVDLAEAEPPYTLTWRSDSHGGECSVRFDLETEHPGTRVIATLRYGTCGAEVPLEPFGWGLLVPLYRRTLRKIHTLDRALAEE
jgi:hypothetical protein